MNEILLTLGGLTLGGSAAVALLALLGRNTRGRYGAKWRCWAWLLLCLLLAIPLPLMSLLQEQAPIQVDLPNPPAAVPPAPAPAPDPAPAPTLPENHSPVLPTPSGGEQNEPDTLPAGSAGTSALEPFEPVSREEEPSLSLSQAVLGMWLVGALAVLLWDIRAHVRFLSYLRRWSTPVTDGTAVQAFNQLGDQLGLDKRPHLLVCEGLKVPMLAGLLQTSLLLPRGTTTGEALGLSLLHELTHYRRRDIWLKTLAMWVNALHWFNPFVWYMVRLVERDTELACDEDALRRLPPELYATYGQTILDAVARLQKKEP